MRVLQIIPDNDNMFLVKSLIGKSSDKRIKKQTLDFYRNGYETFVADGNNVVMLVAYDSSNLIVGISACAIRDDGSRVSHPITIVDREFRNKNLGATLLKRKLDIVSKRYSEKLYRCAVADSNEAAMQLCLSSGMCAVEHGTRVRKDKTIDYTVFEL